MKNDLPIFAVVTPGLEAIAKKELQKLGISRPKLKGGGFSFRASWIKLCELNLCSRVCSGFLVRLGHAHVSHFKALRSFIGKLPWRSYLLNSQVVQLKVTAKKSKLYHTGAIAERVLQGIQDTLGHSLAVVSGKDLPAETQCIVIRLVNNELTCSISSSGAHLHRRGYRKVTAKAPIRENIAAGLLMAIGYDGAKPLLDPMTGSGTFGIEAAMIASNRPPGSGRSFAFMSWKAFDVASWQKLCDEKSKQQIPVAHQIISSDRNPGALEAASKNAQLAGLENIVRFKQNDFSAAIAGLADGWFCVLNPPYGGRIGGKNLKDLYASFQGLRTTNCKTGIITENQTLMRKVCGNFQPISPAIFHGGKRVYFYT